MTRCGLCFSTITLPICPLCLTDKVEIWIEKRKLSLIKAYREEVRNILDKTRYGKISCSICRGEHEKALCSVCFTARIHSWLATKDEKLAIEFAQAFAPKQVKIYA
ncbi:MAG: hypothetical protein QW063_00265 [Candidatus Nanoarchaeia archaeon]